MLKESDLIYGVQAWYKRVLRRIGHVIPSFHEEYVFLAMLGPFDRDSGIVTAQSSTPSWFSISAMFASVNCQSFDVAKREKALIRHFW